MKNTHLSLRHWLLFALAALFLGGVASAQFIDFEVDPTTGNPWSPTDPVNTQYDQAPWHVSFSLGGAGGSPVIADYGGGTQEAWGCATLPDDTLSAFVPYDFGALFITDGNGVQRDPPPLFIDYAPGFEPLRAGGFIHDVDAVSPTLLREQWTIRAFDTAGLPIGTPVVVDPLIVNGGVRDCDSSYWEVVGDRPISRIQLRYTGHPNKQVGLGFDGFFPRLEVTGGSGPCGTELCPRPSHWFPFDDGTPRNSAIAGPLNLKTDSGSPQIDANDGVDGAVEFDGTDDALRLEGGPLEALHRRGMTIGMRLRPRTPAVGARSEILFKGGYDFAAVGWGLYQGSGGKLNITGHTPTGGVWTETSSRILQDDEWVSVTLVIQPCPGVMGQIQLYIDGVLEAAKSLEPFLGFDTYPLRIGTSDFGPWFYRGKMDELSFWDRPLSPCEVANLRMCSTPKEDCNANGISDSVELSIYPERDLWTVTSGGGPAAALQYAPGADGIPDDCQGIHGKVRYVGGQLGG